MFDYISFRLCANPGRTSCSVASRLEHLIDGARREVLESVRATEGYECVFYKSATEALNFVSLGALAPNSRCLVCVASHHSALAP